MLKEYLSFAIRSLRHRQLRTWLTVIGIIIGIASIVALISISQGLENAIVDQFERMGSNRLYIMPEGFTTSFIAGLTTEDSDHIEGMPEVEWVNPYVVTSNEVEFSNERVFIQQIVGINTNGLASKWEDMDFTFIEGRLPEKKQTGIAIVGYNIARDKFKKDMHLKNRIRIKDRDFKIAGILEKFGNEDDDTSVWIETEDFREVFNKPDEVSTIELKLKPGLDSNEAAAKISDRLERYRGNDFFTVFTPEQILEMVGDLLAVIQIVLGGIAAISLVVGGVGIMNSMYTSVLQRRQEIGIMKSIGAKNKQIMLIFVVESGLLGLGGGILGVVLGSAIALLTGEIAAQAGFLLLTIRLDWKLSLFGLFFALFVGMLAGVLPARNAAKMKPAEALAK